MTAEVAILNRNGVALASDSYGLVKIGDKKKFISVNKIFSLSQSHPIGIIISNFVNFMSTPWETIVSVYRSYIGEKSFNTLKEYTDNFISFLTSDKRFSAPLVEKLIIENAIDHCISEVSKSVKLTNDYTKSISNEIEKLLLFYSNQKFLIGFDDSFTKYFVEIHGKELEQYIKMKPEINVDIKTQQNLIKLCAYIICKSNFIYDNYGSSGLVFVGYGDNDIFPSLIGYNIFASIDKNLIYKTSASTTIGIDNKQAIYSFGVTDVLATYIDGINPDLQNMVFKEIDSGFKDLTGTIQNKFQLSEKDQGFLNSITVSAIDNFKNKFLDFQQKNCVEPLLLMVNMLSNQELLSLAESFVHLTLTKQKFSADEQISGGRIHVVSITKGDGYWERYI